MTDGFRSRVDTNVVPIAQRDPGAMRSGLAEGLQQIGGALGQMADDNHRIAMLDKQRAQQSNMLQGVAGLATVKARTDTRIAELQQNIQPGAEGYEKQADAIIDEEAKGFLAALPNDPELRDRLEAQVVEWSAPLRHDQTLFAMRKRAELAGQNYAIASNRWNSELVSDPSELKWIGTVSAIRDTLQTTLPDGNRRMAAETKELAQAAESRAKGMLERGDVTGARDFLTRDDLAGIMSGDQKAALLSRVGIVERQQAVAAERQQREADAAIAGQADALMVQHNAGTVVDPLALRAEAQRVAATDPARSARFAAAAAGAEETAVYGNGNADPSAITTRLGQIEAQKNWERNPDLVARHDTLEKLRTETRNAKPNYAPLDFGNPAAVQRRVADMEAWGRTHNGQRWVLSDDQATQMATMARSGPAEREQVAQMLSRLPGRAAMVGLWQVAPKDAAMRAAIDLPPRLRSEVFRGEALRKDNPKLVPAGDVNARWGERGQRALDALPVEYQAAMKASAENLYATKAVGLTEFDEKLWDQALNEVIDPTGRGGIGEHNGHPIVLPDGMPQAEFDRRWAALPDSFAVRDGAGHAISGANIRRNYHLVPTTADGGYRIADAQGRFALNRNGQPYVLDIRRLNPPAPVTMPAAVPKGPVFVAPPRVDPGVRGPVFVAPPVTR